MASTHRDLRCAYETAHEIAVYANDMMVAGRINGFNVSMILGWVMHRVTRPLDWSILMLC